MGAFRLEPLRDLTLLAALLLPTTSIADDAPYCRKVRARAAAEAARLMSPQLVLQGMRFPRNLAGLPLTELDTISTTPYQGRAGVAFSPLELAKGLTLARASDDDCAEHQARSELEAFVENAEGAARLPALRGQADYLRQQAPRWSELIRQQETAFEEHLITLFELNQLRVRTLALERRLVQASGEAERLAARGYQRPPLPAPTLVQRWSQHALLLERDLSTTRGLSVWNVRLSAGVVMSDRPLDWYGLAELTLHLGAVLQSGPDRRALEAREEELRSERASPGFRVSALERDLGLFREQSGRELALVEAQLAALASTREVLERAESPNVAWAVALLTCDQWVAESERTYLATLITELGALLGERAHD